jgi:hypothetical protein
MANTSINRSRIRGGLNKYDSILVGNTKFVDTVEVSGGLLSSDSTYYYRTFKSSGSLVVTGGSIQADVLVIAGGGGGGFDSAGGGGAGGLLGFTSQSLSIGTYTVTVGAGGAAGATTGAPASNGANSSFGVLTASVGGGGGGAKQSNGASGGSGGGAGHDASVTRTGGTGTSSQGSAGGSGAVYSGGGGGGNAAVGTNGSSNVAGAGGAGSAAYSAWGLATGTGHNVSGTVYYAGGGGGGTYDAGGSGGAAGNGGGGKGGIYATNGAAGTANTGGGGGAQGNGTYTSTFPGGSGIVIVRYLKSAVLPTQTDFELIGTITLSAAQSSVTFTGLPTDYKHLQIRCVAQGTTGNDSADLYFNNDTGANYSWHSLYGNGSSVAADNATSRSAGIPECPALLASSYGVFSVAVIDILDAFSTTKFKTVRHMNGRAVSAGYFVALDSGLWQSTAATSSLKLQARTYSLNAGSRFSIYGARA